MRPVNLERKLKKDWVLSKDAFDRVLLVLDEDREAAGEKYELIRLKLVKYFEWQHSSLPEDLADEAINRLARKLAENGEVHNLNAYLLGIARHIASEDRRQQTRAEKAAKAMAAVESWSDSQEPGGDRLGRCSECLKTMAERDRNLIVRYYASETGSKIEEHKRLASELGLTLNSMRIRVHRIKMRLEQCIRERESNNESG